MEWRAVCFSHVLRDVGLIGKEKSPVVRFSCPDKGSAAGGDGEGDVNELPESVVLLKARLTGLLGETRAARDRGFADAAFGFPDRSESLTAERKGVDKFD